MHPHCILYPLLSMLGISISVVLRNTNCKLGCELLLGISHFLGRLWRRFLYLPGTTVYKIINSTKGLCAILIFSLFLSSSHTLFLLSSHPLLFLSSPFHPLFTRSVVLFLFSPVLFVISLHFRAGHQNGYNRAAWSNQGG
jgi:hypothetical protein